MRYYEIKNEHQERYNKFIESYGFAAFSEKQFNEGKARLKVSNDDELIRVYSGVYLLKNKKDEFINLLITNDKELKEKLLNDKELLKDAFMYELGNHEYCITYDVTETVDALPFTLEEIEESETLTDIFLEAIKEYLSKVDY